MTRARAAQASYPAGFAIIEKQVAARCRTQRTFGLHIAPCNPAHRRQERHERPSRAAGKRTGGAGRAHLARRVFYSPGQIQPVEAFASISSVNSSEGFFQL